jgi:hypothetical protein
MLSNETFVVMMTSVDFIFAIETTFEIVMISAIETTFDVVMISAIESFLEVEKIFAASIFFVIAVFMNLNFAILYD